MPMTKSKLHPIVRLDYIVRISCFPPLIAIFYSVFHAAGRASPTLITLLALWGLLWPQLAWLHARRDLVDALGRDSDLSRLGADEPAGRTAAATTSRPSVFFSEQRTPTQR